MLTTQYQKHFSSFKYYKTNPTFGNRPLQTDPTFPKLTHTKFIDFSIFKALTAVPESNTIKISLSTNFFVIIHYYGI